MNEKKICFITAVNDEDMYKESLTYIKNLNVPLGFEIETLQIRNAKSIFSAYNSGMKSSDAKYKIYLHQDVFIINKNFINDILRIFSNHKSVGLMGVCGAKELPSNAIWWECPNNFGKVYENRTGKVNLLAFKDVVGDIEILSVIDGLIIITQYDITWREDIFDAWHFYDISHSFEFKKNGYEVAVPNQNTPWCIHCCGVVDTHDYERCRQIFIKNYQNTII